MFLAIGHPVLKLKRIEYGPIRLGDLPFGQSRYLTPEEVERLKKLIPLTLPSPRQGEGWDEGQGF